MLALNQQQRRNRKCLGAALCHQQSMHNIHFGFLGTANPLPHFCKILNIIILSKQIKYFFLPSDSYLLLLIHDSNQM